MGAAIYHFPVSIGDTVYTVYAGRVEPCEVAGFQVLEHGRYVYVRYPGVRLEHPVLLSNICLSWQEAQNKIIEKKEEQVYETGTDGGTSSEELGGCE